jgi:hypothetical protein
MYIVSAIVEANKANKGNESLFVIDMAQKGSKSGINYEQFSSELGAVLSRVALWIAELG